MMESTTMALSRQAPEALPKVFATAGTSTCMPSRPNTTLGMPDSSSMAVTTTVRSLGSAALERKHRRQQADGHTDDGSAQRAVECWTGWKGRMPNSGWAAVEAHFVPNRNWNRPILWMAGTPEITMYTEISTTQPTASIPQQEEDEVHHRFHAIRRGCGAAAPGSDRIFCS